MKITRFNEILPDRPLVGLVWGEQGIGKTTLANTAGRAIVWDSEQGGARAQTRGTLTITGTWPEVKEAIRTGWFEEQRSLGYDLFICDTADSVLGLMLADIEDRLKTRDGRQLYGQLKKEFDLYIIQTLRNHLGFNLLFVAHEKAEEKRPNQEHGRFKPDITGGSYSIITRASDYIGYLYAGPKGRVLSFDSSSVSFVAKNSIGLADQTIPNFKTNAEYRKWLEANRTYLKDLIIDPTRANMKGMIEEESEIHNVEAQATFDYWKDRYENALTPETFTKVMEDMIATDDLSEKQKAAMKKTVINPIRIAYKWKYSDGRFMAAEGAPTHAEILEDKKARKEKLGTETEAEEMDPIKWEAVQKYYKLFIEEMGTKSLNNWGYPMLEALVHLENNFKAKDLKRFSAEEWNEEIIPGIRSLQNVA